MDRRTLLARAGLAGAGLVGGGAVVRLVDDDLVRHATPASFASTVAPQAVRGRAQVVWSGPTAAPRLALCFDDGPTEQFTARVLDRLAAVGARATFFTIGALVDRHPDLVRRAHDAGHEIQNHSYDHNSAAVLSAGEVLTGMARGGDAVERVTGTRSTWYRPPRGEVTTATLLAARATGHRLALWSLGRDEGGETRDDDAAGVGRHLRDAAVPGDITSLHDGIGRSSFSGWPDQQLLTRRRAELDALPGALRAWRERGLELVTLSELEHG